MSQPSAIHSRPLRPAARRKPTARLLLEPLEDRCVPAVTFTVNSTADTAAPPAGTITLRSAITAANAAGGADTINFDAALTGQTILLTANLPTITDALTINGLGQKSLFVSGNGAFRPFNIAAGVSVTINDLTVTLGAAAAATDGGGILNAGSLTLNRVTVSLCTASGAGGGIENSTGASLTMTDGLITGNRANGPIGAGAGGGIDNFGTAIITTSTLSDNSTGTDRGGGFENRATGTLTLTRSTVYGNVSGDGGGGIRNIGTAALAMQIINSTIANNVARAGVGGGGMSIDAGTSTILNSTIAGNSDVSGAAAGAGGISLTTGAVNLTNSILAENFHTTAANNNRNTAVGFTDTASTVTDANVVGPLQDNGGPTLTMAPWPNSPVINAGNNAAAATLTTDQRGFLRLVGPTVDRGAVEFQPPQVSVTLTVTPSSPIPFHRVVTLTATVTATSAAPNNPVTGTVTFLVNGTTVLGTAALDASGKATFTTTFAIPLPVGTDTLTARYEGDKNYNPGISNAVTQVVARPIPTPAVFDPATGTWYIRNSFSGGPPSITAFAFGAPGDEPIMGDWNGDGVFGIGVFTPSTATFHLRNTATPGPADFTFVFGPSSADLGGNKGVPVAGDWDGDGVWSVGVFAPSRGDWNLRNENTSGLPDAGSFLFGALGSKPVAGDWDGDGTFSQGVIEPDGTWKLKNVKATGNPDFTFAYGSFADQHVAGDWDGNGTWTPGVLQDNGAGALVWKLRNSNSGGPPDITPFTYGATSFIGLVGDPDFPVLPQFALGGQGPGAGSISQADLGGIVQAALGRLGQEGMDPATLGRLAHVTALLQPLAPGQLGGAIPQANTILLSPNGAGHGWFVDPTPYMDEEFSGGAAYVGSPAAGREDLLTTVMHELGHLAGLPDNDGSGLMVETLAAGVRRTDLLSAVFAGSAPVVGTPQYSLAPRG